MARDTSPQLSSEPCDACGNPPAGTQEEPIHIFCGWRLCHRCWIKGVWAIKKALRLPPPR